MQAKATKLDFFSMLYVLRHRLKTWTSAKKNCTHLRFTVRIELSASENTMFWCLCLNQCQYLAFQKYALWELKIHAFLWRNGSRLFEFLFFEILIQFRLYVSFRSVDVTDLKTFLFWFKHANVYRVIHVFFQLSVGLVGQRLKCVRQALYEKFVPCHLGFGVEHKLTMDRIRNDLSTWMCKAVSENLFKRWVVAVIDGTYIFCMNFGGFLGQKLLYSLHKKRRLSKVRKIALLTPDLAQPTHAPSPWPFFPF